MSVSHENVEALVSFDRVRPAHRESLQRFLGGIDAESWASYTCAVVNEARRKQIVLEKENEIFDPETIAVVARHGNVIMGVGFALSQSDPKRPWDLGLVVAKEYRGRKLGEALLREVLKDAAARGVMSIATITGNPAAANAMDHAGLTVVPTGEHNEWQAGWKNPDAHAEKAAA